MTKSILNKIKLNNFIIMFLFSIVYVIPISSNIYLNNPSHGDIYYYSRMFLAPIGLCCLAKKASLKPYDILEYIILLMVSVTYTLVNGVLPLTCIALLPMLFVFDYIYKINKFSNVDFELLFNFLRKAKLLFLIQVCIVSFLLYQQTGYFRIESTFKDANYTGYFLLILYFIFRENTKMDNLWMLLALMTFSRTAFISIIIIIFYKIFKNKIGHRIIKPEKVCFVCLVVWIIVCGLYVVYFNSIDYSYVYREGFSRITNYVDYSNYIRASLNVALIDDMNIKNLLLGYTDEEFIDLIFFEGKNEKPHNLFFSIYKQCGFFYAIAVFRRFVQIFKRYNMYVDMFYVMLIYAMILGPSMYYVVDMLIVLIGLSIRDFFIDKNFINGFRS